MHSQRPSHRHVGLLLLLGLGAGSPAALALQHPSRPAQGPGILIQELQYDPPGGPDEAAHEWVELYNAGDEALSLQGWELADNRSGADLSPAGRLEAGAFLIVAGGPGFGADHPGFTGRVLTLGGAIGNGLGNTGDRLRLLDAAGRQRDAMSYGSDATFLVPPAPDVAPGHSLERVPPGTDTDLAADWADQARPSPGEAGQGAAQVATPSPAPRPSLPPGETVRLNEVLPAPKAVDWNGDGRLGQDDEWIELFNPRTQPVFLRGWRLDDAVDAGSDPYVFPDTAVIGPRGHLLVFQDESGLVLNNDADQVVLLAPDGQELDSLSYRASKPDQSQARWPDGEGPWTDGLRPSPGSANGAGGTVPPGPDPTDPASTPAASPEPGGAGATATAAAASTPAPTGSGDPTATGPTPSPAGATPSAPAPTFTLPTPTAPTLLLPLLISELLFDPATSGNDAAEEWAELFNPGPAAIRLAGWSVGDREAWDALPDGLLPAGGYAVIAAGEAQAARLAAQPGRTVLRLADGSLGGGLGNGGDVLRLRDPTGRVVDAVSYGDNLDAFDPAVPLGPPGSSIERLPSGQDTDSAEDWWIQDLPSPGAEGKVSQGPPPLFISELLPAPQAVDWDGDGKADHLDEWIELVNTGDRPVGLADWRLEDRPAAGWSFRFPAGSRIEAGAYLVLPRALTGIALVREADTLRLIRPDGMEADRASWAESPGMDRAVCRLAPRPGDAWRLPCEPSPGKANRLAPAPTAGQAALAHPSPSPTGGGAAQRVSRLAELRGLADGSRVRVEGRVTAPPGTFDRRALYIGDEEAGIRVYLSRAADSLPDLAEGDAVSLSGRLGSHEGERELRLSRAADLRRLGEGRPVAPLDLATGRLGEDQEGRLVRLAGQAAGRHRYGFRLDDGSGAAAVYLDPDTGIQAATEAELLGQAWAVVGIVGQRESGGGGGGGEGGGSPARDSGHRLMPRYPRDLQGTAAAWRSYPLLPGAGRREEGR